MTARSHSRSTRSWRTRQRVRRGYDADATPVDREEERRAYESRQSAHATRLFASGSLTWIDPAGVEHHVNLDESP